MSVDNFIRRIECQGQDTLGGELEIVCDHAQCFFEKTAKDWYWRYRLSRKKVTWESLCNDIRKNFADPTSDSHIKDSMRARKQGHLEPFDEYRQSILKLASLLKRPIQDEELVKIMQRGLKPRLREQLMFVTIHSESHLRELCLTAESVFNEIRARQMPKKTSMGRRIASLDLQVDDRKEDELEKNTINVEEVSRRPLKCWNCQEEVYRFQDCVEQPTVFCYGCGKPNIYKRNCPICNPENLQKSEVTTRKRR